MKRRSHLVIRGRVQGVCYRMCAEEEAGRLGLTGWIRNRLDGAVEAVAEGDEEDLRRFVEWCRSGPPHARVAGVDQTQGPATGEFTGFSTRY